MAEKTKVDEQLELFSEIKKQTMSSVPPAESLTIESPATLPAIDQVHKEAKETASSCIYVCSKLLFPSLPSLTPLVKPQKRLHRKTP